jgi:hypothetical protein
MITPMPRRCAWRSSSSKSASVPYSGAMARKSVVA